jgi:DNA polymerase
MRQVTLPLIGTVAAWRAEARSLARMGADPRDVLWRVGKGPADLFAAAAGTGQGGGVDIRLPRDAMASIETALHHSDPERFARAYEIVLRLSRGDLRWGDRSDAGLHRLLAQEKAVRRAIHKMHAFVRFREVGPPGATRRAFAAWFEPDHPVTEAAAPFFARRFGDMDWIIATPHLTARFEAGCLAFETSGDRRPPPEDATEALWRTYFVHIFNPARLMVSAMTSEMPRKYWKNLPEAALIPDMIRTAPARARAMQDASPTIPPAHADRIRPRRASLPDPGDLTLATMKPAMDACRRCRIGACATQAVAGEGPLDARLMIVGEQPGDAEDLVGRPFVGPAGGVFDRALAKAGVDRAAVFVTNAVKHFKFRPDGKRRLHQRPEVDEVAHCRWWLDVERRLIKPRAILALGATAALSLTGTGERILQRRGGVERLGDGTPVLVSVHPSYILRRPDLSAQDEAAAALSADMAHALALAASDSIDRGGQVHGR